MPTYSIQYKSCRHAFYHSGGGRQTVVAYSKDDLCCLYGDNKHITFLLTHVESEQLKKLLAMNANAQHAKSQHTKPIPE